VKQLKLISDKIERNGQTIIYNRRIVEYDPDKNKTSEEKYKDENLEQFYDFLVPEVSKEC